MQPSLLLVEDETVLREIYGEALKDSGFRVFRAATRLEALELIPDILNLTAIISDIDMPLLRNQKEVVIGEGLKLVEDVRANLPNILILLMTGRADNLLKSKPSEIDTVLAKPFLPNYLVQKVKELLDQKSALV